MMRRMSAPPVDLTRRQVLAHRFAAQGLHRTAVAAAELAVLDLGVQNSPPGALPVALSARLRDPLAPDVDLTAGGALSLVWSHRGAPHLHRAADLPALAAACWPRDDADAAARLGWQRARLAEVGGASRDALRTVADAVRAVLDGPMTKAELSAAVTARVPAELSPFCRGCDVHHVGEQLLRLAGLPAGIRLRPGGRPLVLEPVPEWAGPPADGDAGTTAVQRAFVRTSGPVSDADLAAHLGTTRAAVVPDRPGGLVPVRVDGRPAAVDADLVAAIQAAEPPDTLRLLPPSDPWLGARDREVTVPDAAHRTRIWVSLGAPGIVLAGVEVVAVWRTRQRGRTLRVETESFGPRVDVGPEAERLALARGAAAVEVVEV
jgi:hypothetical protein